MPFKIIDGKRVKVPDTVTSKSGSTGDSVVERNRKAALKVGDKPTEDRPTFSTQEALAKRERGAPISAFVGDGKSTGGATDTSDANKTQISPITTDGIEGDPFEKGPTFATGGRDEIEQQARARIAGERNTRVELGEELGLEGAVRTTLQKEVDARKEQQKIDRERQRRVQSRQRALEESEFGAQVSRAGAATSAATAQFAQGRETPMSESSPMLATQFATETKRNIDNSRRRLLNAQESRDQLKERLIEAQRAGNESLIETIAGNIANQEKQIRSEQEFVANTAAQATQQAFDYLEQAPAGTLADLSVGEIAASFNIDPVQASLMKAQDISKSTIDPTTPEGQMQLAQIRKANAEAATAGLTTGQKNFVFAQTLEGAEKDQFLNFAGTNPTFGFTTMGNKIFATNPLTGSIQQVAGGGGGGQKIPPSGKMVTGNVNGKNVTLDSSALFGLEAANGAANTAGFGGINVTDSTRDQKQTILTMAAKFGVPVNPGDLNSVNQAAATLSAGGHKVAAVGNSNHEYGLAVDIFPSDPASSGDPTGQNYIANVKPFMEANGWKQSTDSGDKGHFNFVGMTVYSPEQKAVMNSINLTKYSGTDAKSLADSDLSYSDLASFKSTQGLTPEQKKLAENVKDKTQAALGAIDNIIDNDLLKSAGRSGLILPSLQIGVQDLQAEIDTIISSIALDEMKALKEASPTGSTGFGALSEKELNILTSSKGAIRVNISEDLLKKNLESIRLVLQKASGISEETTQERRVLTDQTEIQEVHTMLQKLQSEGATDEEMISTLESQGIDATQFIN